MTDIKPPSVYEALGVAIASLGYVAPDGQNTNQGFAFRSIDGVVGATRNVMNAAGLSLIPSFESLEQTDYTKADGRVSHRSILLGTFRLIGPAGDDFIFTTIGEAMDTEGRASNKAMSAATKNALLRLFQIGAGSDDGDGLDEVPHRAPQSRATAPQSRQAPPVATTAPAPGNLGERVQAAAGRAQGTTQPNTQTGEIRLLTPGQGKNLFRLWKHVLGWDKQRFLQQVEMETGAVITDDRNLTFDQASTLITALKILGGEEVEEYTPQQPLPDAPSSSPFEGYGYSEEPF